MKKSPSPKRPMTPEEITAVGMLKGVRYPIGTWDKKCASGLLSSIQPPAPKTCTCPHEVPQLFPTGTTHRPGCPGLDEPWQPMITNKMAPQLWRILFRYRRQIRHPERKKYLQIAEERMVPDYRSTSYRREQEARYRIEAMKREAKAKEAK